MQLFTDEQISRLKPGLSGIMRVKNDGELVGFAIDSCIDALDELIVVYNDCSDNSVEIIEEKQKKHPDKIRIFGYPHHILSLDLDNETFDYVNSLPEDNPQLLCNYYNFALSKVSCRHAIKIDADQIYFTDRLNHYRELCHKNDGEGKNSILGYLFFSYFKLYRKLSVVCKRVFPFMPERLIRALYPKYLSWQERQFLKGKASLSFSGTNVFLKERWCVSMGHKGSGFVVLPPFNGEGDHLLFRVSKETHYEKFSFDYYASLRGSGKAVIEQFRCPQPSLPAAFLWFHMASMRKNIRIQLAEEMSKQPSWFIRLDELPEWKYDEITKQADGEVFSLYQRILFKLMFSADFDSVLKHEHILDNIRNGFFEKK